MPRRDLRNSLVYHAGDVIAVPPKYSPNLGETECRLPVPARHAARIRIYRGLPNGCLCRKIELIPAVPIGLQRVPRFDVTAARPRRISAAHYGALHALATLVSQKSYLAAQRYFPWRYNASKTASGWQSISWLM